MKINRVYVVVLPVGDHTYRQRRWTWKRARAQRWADKLNQGGGGWRVEETTLVSERTEKP